MRALDLFSGIGVFGLASRNLGIETAAFCEIDPYRQQVLSKNFPGIPVYSDIKKLRNYPHVDCVFSGFPCQDISLANRKGKGLKGSRSALWNEMLRVITEVKPNYVVVENVPPTGSSDRHWTAVAIPDLQSLGYIVEQLNLSAAMLGGCHGRKRCFVVAYSSQNRRSSTIRFNTRVDARASTRCRPASDSDDAGNLSWRLPNGEILRGVDGIAPWLDRYFQYTKPTRTDRHRIAACGDAIYLPCAEFAIKYCIKIDNLNQSG